MAKISNCLLMLEYLENGRKYNIKELAEKLEVSERMVRSYKEELEKAGIFIDSIMGPYGGYVLNQSIKIPLRKFSKENYEFLKNNLPPVVIAKEDRVKYFEFLRNNDSNGLAEWLKDLSTREKERMKSG